MRQQLGKKRDCKVKEIRMSNFILKIFKLCGLSGPFTSVDSVGSSVADPGCLSRIRIFSISDPGSASKNLSILTQKIVPPKILEMLMEI
jgi:hypothetical protein